MAVQRGGKVAGFVFVDELPGPEYRSVRSPNRRVRPEAQALFDFAAALRDVEEEPHPADWNRLGLRAGPERNDAMVAAGADVCLAFPLGTSRGTRHCMRAAEKAGIPVLDLGGGTP